MAKHGHDLLYSYKAKKWLTWNGRYWEWDYSGEVERRAKDTVMALYREAGEIADEDRRKAMVRFALKSEGRDRIAAMMKLAQSETGIPVLPRELDANPWLLNCLNGTIDLRTGELRPHCREDLITCLAPVAYDPEAECPEFEKFLYQIMANCNNKMYFLWLSLGYALTGSCQEQCLWIFWGGGANGKSTLLNCITEILGNYAMHIATDTLITRKNPGEIRNDVARLDGPRFVTASEIDKGRRLGESLVKELTGTDPVTARYLYGEPFDFIPQFKLFIATNNKPIIRDNTNAIWRRIKLVEFPMDFKDHPDRELPDKLRAEMPGILAWLVKGCLDWQRHVDLGEPPEVTESTAQYRAEMNVLREFLDDKCLVGANLTATAHELYHAYNDWAEEGGLGKRERLYQRSFGLALAEQGFKRGKGTGGVRLWRGIGLRLPDL